VLRLAAAAGVALGVTATMSAGAIDPGKGVQPGATAPADAGLAKLAEQLRPVWWQMSPQEREIIRGMGLTDRLEFTRRLSPWEQEQVEKFIAGVGSPAAPQGLRGPGPANDVCSGATLIPLSSGQTLAVAADNSGATTDAPAPPFGTGTIPICGFTNASQCSGTLGIWFRIVGTGNRINVSTCGSSVDRSIRVFCGDCTNLVCVGADDDGCVTNSLAANVGFCTTAGVDYFVLVHNYGTGATQGAFTLDVVDSGAPCGGASACTAAPPPNDTCAGAIPLTIPGSVVDTVISATPDSIPSCTVTGTSNSVWYSFVGNGNTIQLTTCNAMTGSNSAIAVFAGSCASLSCVAGNTTNTSTAPCSTSPRDDRASVSVCTIPGATYYVAVLNDTNGCGMFQLDAIDLGVCPNPPPPNDYCGTAASISIGGPTVLGTNLNATTETGLQTCNGISTFTAGVWYTFTGNGNRLTASTCNPGTTSNTRVHVYRGTCGVLTCVDARTVDSPACGVRPDAASVVNFCTVAGEQYFILVSNEAAPAGAFELSLTDSGTACSPPANDSCASAAPIAINGSNVVASNADALNEPPTPTIPTCTIAAPFYGGMWYTFTGNGFRVTASTCNAGTNFNTRLAIYTGSCGALTCVAGNATASPACGIRADAATVANVCTNVGQQYWILVANDATDPTVRGTFELSLVSTTDCTPPPNDNCAGAISVAVGGSVTGDNLNATNESPTPPTCNGLSTFNLGMWYSVTGNGNVLEVTTCDPATVLNTRVYVYSGTCGVLTCVNANATAVPACTPSTAASVIFCSTLGQTYYVLVTNDTAGTGAFTLRVVDRGACPANDLCSNAVTLAVPSTTVVSTLGASIDTGAPTCTTTLGQAGVWYKVIGNGNRYKADTCDSSAGNFDTRISVYCASQSANPCANLSALPCITGIDNATLPPPDGCGSGSQQSRVDWCTQIGASYFILIHGGTGTQGPQGTTTLTLTDLGSCTGAASCAPVGACCTGGGACSITTAAACTGSYQGDGTSCFPPTGSPTTYTINPGLAIPDAGCTTPGFSLSTQSVPDTYTVGDVNVRVAVPAHTFIGDLRINLVHGSTTVRLWLNQCGGNDGLDVTFDDEGVPVVCAQPTTGTYRPLDPLSAFDGQSVNGDWTIQICDSVGADIGTLTTWSLIVTAAGPNPCPSGPDCFTRGSPGPVGACPPNLTYNRPTNPGPGHFVMGGASGVGDASECKPDWNGDGCRNPADVAQFVSSWFYSAQNPGNTDGDYNCDTQATPSDVAAFVSDWFDSINNPGNYGC
jgi:subtilisin-like proprotein convertase family protein